MFVWIKKNTHTKLESVNVIFQRPVVTTHLSHLGESAKCGFPAPTAAPRLTQDLGGWGADVHSSYSSFFVFPEGEVEEKPRCRVWTETNGLVGITGRWGAGTSPSWMCLGLKNPASGRVLCTKVVPYHDMVSAFPSLTHAGSDFAIKGPKGHR